MHTYVCASCLIDSCFVYKHKHDKLMHVCIYCMCVCTYTCLFKPHMSYPSIYIHTYIHTYSWTGRICYCSRLAEAKWSDVQGEFAYLYACFRSSHACVDVNMYNQACVWHDSLAAAPALIAHD